MRAFSKQHDPEGQWEGLNRCQDEARCMKASEPQHSPTDVTGVSNAGVTGKIWSLFGEVASSKASSRPYSLEASGNPGLFQPHFGILVHLNPEAKIR